MKSSSSKPFGIIHFFVELGIGSKFLNTPQKLTAQAEKNPLKKIGAAKDVAEAAAYLLLDKSSWITGQILHVDGGFSTIK